MTCPVCHCVFCPGETDRPPEAPADPQLYCSHTCKTRAKRWRNRPGEQELRRKRSEAVRRAKRCEAQGKKRYGSRKEALVELRRINTITGLGLHSAYQCGDHWHLTRQRVA